MAERRFATIHDVAADANVSIATVSRVLNEPWRVIPETRERVVASIQKLGYTPNLRARLLAKGGSGTICFLLSNRPFIRSIHARMLQGASGRADETHVQVVFAACSYSPDTPPSSIEMPRMLAARGLIDGVIVAGTNYPNMLDALAELELPFVVYGGNLITPGDKRIPNAIYVEDEEGGGEATRYLISLGHRRIRFIGDLEMPWYRRRYMGYVRAMSEAGLECLPALGALAATSTAEDELAMGFNAVNEMLDAGARFTAVFAGGDPAALGVMRALRNRGLGVPSDVSVVGFNDEEISEAAEPSLTTVRVPTDEAGMRCVEMLDAVIKGAYEATEPVVLPVKLVVRQSCAVEKQA